MRDVQVTKPPVAEWDPRLVLAHDPGSPDAASYRSLRHAITAAEHVRVVAVVSPHAGEGKSVTAANLAFALSEHGRGRVLLVEANPRAPSLAKLFGFLPPLDLGAQLAAFQRDPRTPWSVVQPIPPWLSVLAYTPDRAPEAVDPVAFGGALRSLREAEWDWIVVDGPAVLGQADANAVADAADGILVVTTPRSRARDLRKTVDQLGRKKLLGAAHREAG